VKPTKTQDITVLELPFFDVQVDETTPGSEVARLFEADHALPGIIVMSEGKFRGMVSRNQFFQRLGRPFGIEVYSTRRITAFLDSVTVPPLEIAPEATIQNASIRCLARPLEHVYDPFVVTACAPPRLIDFLALIVKQTELITAAQIEAHEQRVAAVSASNAKSDFLAAMSHELRTPLTAIIGYGEILIEDFETGLLDQSLPRVRSIVTSGRHLLEMINSILDLSKIEARKMDLYRVDFSLRELLAEIVSLIDPLLRKNDNHFTLHSDFSATEMHTDETKLRQCLLNLLSNASKFTHGGRIALEVRRESRPAEEWVIFRVTDTGIGMTEAQMARLFEAFYQVDSSISRNYGGTGLGLSLTKQFCEMLGGTLTVQSVLNQGTTFTMEVPVNLRVPGESSS
jgi:signal transduction histidine kinase